MQVENISIAPIGGLSIEEYLEVKYHRLLAIHKKSRTYLSIMKISVAVIMGFIFF